MVRLQAIAFLLQALALWCLIAVGFVMAALNKVPSYLSNYENSLILSFIYFVIGFILYARSRSLAKYFTDVLEIDDVSSRND
jgi:hypothetical protein